MLSVSLLSALVATASIADAHFHFGRLAVNGEWKPLMQYIRNKTSPFEDEPWTPYQNWNTRDYFFPTYATDLPNSVRCGRGNLAWAPKTDILRVKAGDTMEFVAFGGYPYEWNDTELFQFEGCPEGRGVCSSKWSGGMTKLQHFGPVLVHLSQVPEGQSLTSYDGSGEWVKIHTTGFKIVDGGKPWWLAYNGLDYQSNGQPERFIFKVPKQTPAGQYLMRVDLAWPGFVYKLGADLISDVQGQLYPSCAQIEVESDVTGSLPKGIKIPEDLQPKSQGMQTSLEMYNNQKVDEGYVYPGGPLWDGEKLIEDMAPTKME
ncbi:hypothetical protein P154DRAFT_572046 [Amniculicola lignicola CBS 123094]|uniref:AA9 family lytic polysaccharide monooxygenase n=1 Tax=Amniculicola lignicola CBS 123094 TaxID=1392246 RepID=A0A6A5WS42_9PLEO|nr:hypothetical protein P154DRAFT_572046 [Amniculicola lignicola CBS 123094]